MSKIPHSNFSYYIQNLHFLFQFHAQLAYELAAAQTRESWLGITSLVDSDGQHFFRQHFEG